MQLKEREAAGAVRTILAGIKDGRKVWEFSVPSEFTANSVSVSDLCWINNIKSQ